jgi:C4-dicarboxylate transporter/malic acid transport protein
MSTGGVAFVLSVVPPAYRFSGLTTIGTVIFVMNLFIFAFVTTAIATRFIIHPGTFTSSLANPHEGFFFATFWLSLATMITNTTAYGIPNSGPWLIAALRYSFWVYTICATLLAIFYYHVLFTVKKLVITNVLPGWVLPIFPAMLVGTLASAIAKTQPAENALPILVAGLSYQGLGFFVALMMYGIYFGRLLTSGLPIYMSRPAMFIAVGPPSFTALAFIGMGQDVVAAKIFETYTTLPGIVDQTLIPDFFQLLALLFAIFLWVFALWFFAIALVATIEAIPRNDFHLNWYAYVFPNVGFTISALKIGERLNSPAIQAVGTGMAAVLFFLWILIMVCHFRAVVQRKICWPGKDEDAH